MEDQPGASAARPTPDHPYPNAVAAFPTLRQSLLSNFDNCALMTRFEMKYRDGWDSHPQGRGKLTHATIAACLHEMSIGGERSIPATAALGILHETLRQTGVDDYCHTPGCELPATWLDPKDRPEDGKPLVCPKGHRHWSEVVNIPMREIKDLYWIIAKWASDNEWDVANLVSIEERINATLRYPDPRGGLVERIFTGQLDALFLDPNDETHAIVLDHKDTWALPPQTEISFEGYFQQRSYAFLVMRQYPQIQKVTLREFYVRFGEPREAVVERRHLEDIEAELSALAERFDRAYEMSNWKPTPGKHCNFCPRPAACPIPRFARGDGRITDEERAKEVAAQLLVAEVVVKQSHKALRAYVEYNGPVPVKNAKGNSYYGFKKVERTRKPTPEEADRAQRNGIPVASLFKTSTGTRFELITERPERENPESDDALLASLEAALAEAQKRKP